MIGMLFIAILSGCQYVHFLEEKLSTYDSKFSIVRQPAPASKNKISNVYYMGGKGYENGNRIIRTADGGLIIFGNTASSFGLSTDYIALKLSKNGDFIWAKTYGGEGAGIDKLIYTVATHDNGFLMFGESTSNFFTSLKYGTYRDSFRPFLIKIDSFGAVQWANTLELNAANVFSVIQTQDHDYVIAGLVIPDKNSSRSQIAVFKLSENGNLAWARICDVGNTNIAFSVTESADGDLILSGHKQESNGAYPLLMKLDRNGNPLWAKIYSINNSSREKIYFRQVFHVSDGSLIAAGQEEKQEGTHILVMKLKTDGEIIWSKFYERHDNNNFIKILAQDNGNYLILGSQSNGNTRQPKMNTIALIIGTNGEMLDSLSAYDAGVIFEDAVTSENGIVNLVGTTSLGQYLDFFTVMWEPNINKPNLDYLTATDQKFSLKEVGVKVQKIEVDPSDVRDYVKVKNLSFKKSPPTLISE